VLQKKQTKLTHFGIILDSKPFAMTVLSIKLIIYIFLIQTMGLCNKPSTKSPTSIASILLTHTIKYSGFKCYRRRQRNNSSFRKITQIDEPNDKTNKMERRHIIRDIPYLFVCLEDSSLFIAKSYVDCKVTVLHNRTIDVHLTLDREMEIDQSFFKNQLFEIMIHHVHSKQLQITWEKSYLITWEKSFLITWEKSFLITFFTSSNILQMLTKIRKFILIT
jgi:hypothetical protein